MARIRRCEVCGRFLGDDDKYYRAAVYRVDMRKRRKGRKDYFGKTEASVLLCERHAKALENMLEVIAKRRGNDGN